MEVPRTLAKGVSVCTWRRVGLMMSSVRIPRTSKAQRKQCGLPAMLISASPSSTCTSASDGAVCSLKPCPFIKRKDGHVPSWLLNNFAADNGAVLVVHQPGGLGGFGAGESFGFGRGFRIHGGLIDQRFSLPLVTVSLFLGFFRVPEALGLCPVTATE